MIGGTGAAGSAGTGSGSGSDSAAAATLRRRRASTPPDDDQQGERRRPDPHARARWAPRPMGAGRSSPAAGSRRAAPERRIRGSRRRSEAPGYELGAQASVCLRSASEADERHASRRWRPRDRPICPALGRSPAQVGRSAAPTPAIEEEATPPCSPGRDAPRGGWPAARRLVRARSRRAPGVFGIASAPGPSARRARRGDGRVAYRGSRRTAYRAFARGVCRPRASDARASASARRASGRRRRRNRTDPARRMPGIRRVASSRTSRAARPTASSPEPSRLASSAGSALPRGKAPRNSSRRASTASPSATERAGAERTRLLRPPSRAIRPPGPRLATPPFRSSAERPIRIGGHGTGSEDSCPTACTAPKAAAANRLLEPAPVREPEADGLAPRRHYRSPESNRQPTADANPKASVADIPGSPGQPDSGLYTARANLKRIGILYGRSAPPLALVDRINRASTEMSPSRSVGGGARDPRKST